MTRQTRRRAREVRRRHAIILGAAAVAVAVGLAWSAVTFAPLVSAGVDVTPKEPTPAVFDPPQIAEELDAAGMAQVGATALFTHLEAVRHAAFVDFAKGLIMHDHWLHIGRCEQPGSGYGGVDWQGGGYNHQGLFMGGLGISAQAWAENAWDMPADGRAATWGQQMIVATRIYAYAGPGGWGCK